MLSQMQDTGRMGKGQAGVKRKRSVIACSACHDRKVRCNVSVGGVPCSNCAQDGNRCEVYRRNIAVPGQRPLRQKQSHPEEERTYPLTPSPGSTRERNDSTPAGVNDVTEHARHSIATARAGQDHSQRPRPMQQKQPGVADRSGDVVPYYAGESEGLEFLFDQCSPDRPIQGTHYLTPRKTYRHKRSTNKIRRLEPALPSSAIQEELIKCFFRYIYPVLPLVDAKNFLEAFERDVYTISPLLLWSIFFAALNFVDKDVLRVHRMPSRKILKEQYYQYAKDIVDNQEENDKTTLIQSALLLAMWYVDLEDRDGTWHWIGTAISLSHTVGLHRASNYAAMQPCPFALKTRRLWQRLWWCCFYREMWIAMGFGRPMRVHIDDCDQPMPSSEDMLDEVREISSHLREKYLPADMVSLVNAWIVLLHLSIILGDILTMHYRPRSVLPAPSVLHQQEASLIDLRNEIPCPPAGSPPNVMVHLHHLGMYFDGVLIALYRPYLAVSPDRLTTQEHRACRIEVVESAKASATSMTNIVNKLISINAVNQSPSMFVSAQMAAMQVLVFDIRNSSGLAKSYASHQLDLHMLVLSHLRKTYWTADLQHNLFAEVIKVMNSGGCQTQQAESAPTPANDRMEPATADTGHTHPEHTDAELFDANHGLTAAAFDDLFMAFNPFMGLPSHDELSTSVDWELSPSSSLALESLHQRLP